MEKGLFFDGIHIPGDQFAIDQTGQNALSVFPDPADPPSDALNEAAMAAQVALDLERVQAIV
jgi:hypothetical protein